MTAPGPFSLVTADVVTTILDGSVAAAADLVRAVYVEAAAGGVVNPPSLFLRPEPGRPERFIALPAAVRSPSPAAGMKWIGSFPGNLARGLPRASAVIVLNDLETGFPVACLEGAVISATRTALSAAVGAETLAGRRETGRLAVIGAGVISRRTIEMLLATGWRLGEVAAFDERPDQADGLLRATGTTGFVAGSASEAVAGADLVLIATTATTPWFDDPALTRAGVTVLHLSLRDITAGAMAACEHVVDDPTHAAREGTSLELAIREAGVAQESVRPIGALLSEAAPPRDPARPVIYSPFGLGSLDVALARFVLDQARERGLTIEVPGFFGVGSRV
ncbi:MAG TPA: 2,3-diaminopropionate biosynthesis protein SbnB [Acidimicrobiia bacterium]|nr:2,3-diaminopropionate biosynthesis protein SbnB [Acidimicrobiia bacterium]